MKVFDVTGEEACKVSCESISDHLRHPYIGTLKTCWMKETTSINSTGVTVSTSDDSIGALDFEWNKKIFYLPEYLGEKFPNIVVYHAPGCSIKKVSRTNFIGLSRLRVLHLNYNQIEMIKKDTFDDLIALDYLDLRKYKLKNMKFEQKK